MGFQSARIKAGKKISDVMDYMGVSDATVYNWETGTYTPRKDKLLKLAEFYGVTVDELLREEEANE